MAGTAIASMLDLSAIANATLHQMPYPYMVVENSLPANAIMEVDRDFPDITQGGSFPLSELTYGRAFATLVAELQSLALKQIIAEKFTIDLTNRPTMLTVRGFSREKDGRIHTDTKSKLITVLLYLNPQWNQVDDGRLRILNSGTDINDYVDEITPLSGTMVIFKVTDNCWHGYKHFVGERRAIQLNYVVDKSALGKQLSRHSFSAKLKGIKKLFSK